MIPKSKELPDIKAIAQTIGKMNGLNLRQQSAALGFNEASLYRMLIGRDLKISMLIGLSNLHQRNMLQIYFPHLQESLRKTDNELQLEKEISALKNELEKTRQERDKYFDALAGKR